MNFLLVSLFLASQIYGATYWVCSSYDGSNSPGFVIAKDPADNAKLLLEKDWVRSEGTMPEGTYAGKLKPSASGHSMIAKFDVSSFFLNKSAGSKGSFLSLSLVLQNGFSASEVYLLMPTISAEYSGSVVAEYLCRGRGAN